MQCGATITHSVALTADLVCADVGLVVAGNGVVVDLGGHELKAKTALLVKDVRRTVVRNGAITGDNVGGVKLENTLRTTFSNATIAAGIAGTGARNTLLHKVTQGNWYTQTLFSEGSSVTVSESSVQGYSFRCYTSSPCRIDNSQTQISDYLNCDEDSSLTFRGGFLNSTWMGCTNLTIRGARVYSYQVGAVNLTITDSTLDGFIVYATKLVVLRNRFDVDITGMMIVRLDNGVIRGNTFSNMASAGLTVNLDTPLAGRVVVEHNTFTANGFRPSTWDKGGNVIDAGAHFYLPSGGDLVVRDNHSADNHAYGYWAQPGTVVDGGGNTSVNNPLGCLGIAC
ncbi:right-handed parallel beta-helix repeat-containing protein [Umezawaea sp.]|uniref:right-handed parallel beta-helix repeat-containing protein n=1 Tax=Umezawaea sp. TaxID=1955258 RepID=UPI002ED424CA